MASGTGGHEMHQHYQSVLDKIQGHKTELDKMQASLFRKLMNILTFGLTETLAHRTVNTIHALATTHPDQRHPVAR